MTITSETARNDYTGDGSTATYAYTFKVFQDADLKVVKTINSVDYTLALTTDYTVTGAGEDAGGTIVLTAGNLTSGHGLSIQRQVAFTQTRDIRNQGTFNADQIMAGLDKLTMLAQQLDARADRSLQVPEGEDSVAVLPGAANRASSLLGFDANGDPVMAASLPENANSALVTATGSTTERTLADRFAEIFNIKNFGAKGDGVTDDTAAIQAAISALPALDGNGMGGGIVFFPSGRYRITGTLTVSKSGATLKGCGPKASSLLCENAGTSITYSDPGHTDVSVGRFQMEDLGIRAYGNAANTGIGTAITSVFSSTFKNVEWYNFNRNLKLFTAYSNTFLNCHHFTCPVGVTLDAGCIGNNFIGGTMRLTSLADGGQNNRWTGIDFEPGQDLVNVFGQLSHVENCYFELATSGTNYWLSLDSYSTFVNNILAWSVSARPDEFLVHVIGHHAKIANNATSYSDRVFKFANTAHGNHLVIDSFHLPVVSGINEYACYPVLDLGSGNIVEWVGQDGVRSVSDGNCDNKCSVDSNRSFTNLVRTHAENDLQAMTSALTVDIADPFGGTNVYKDTITGGGGAGIISNNPRAVLGNGSTIYTYSIWIYIPAASTMTDLLPFGGAYFTGRTLTKEQMTTDKWIRLIQFCRPANGVDAVPGIRIGGPVGAIIYHSYDTLYAGQNPGTPADYLTASTKSLTW